MPSRGAVVSRCWERIGGSISARSSSAGAVFELRFRRARREKSVARRRT
jgi:hypothetical protein